MKPEININPEKLLNPLIDPPKNKFLRLLIEVAFLLAVAAAVFIPIALASIDMTDAAGQYECSVMADGYVKVYNREAAMVKKAEGIMSLSYDDVYNLGMDILSFRTGNEEKFDIIMSDRGSEYDNNERYLMGTNIKDLDSYDVPTYDDIEGLVLKDELDSTIRIWGDDYFASVQEIDNGFFLVSVCSAYMARQAARTLTILMIVASLGLALVIYLYARKIIKFDREAGIYHKIKKYPFFAVDRTVSGKVLPIITGGLFIILVFFIFVNTLTSVLDAAEDNRERVESAKSLYEMDYKLRQRVNTDINDAVLNNMIYIADSLEKTLYKATSESLAEMSRSNNYDYIMIFDADGNLVLTDSPFGGISLRDISEEEDLCPLLTGVEPIYSKPSITSYISDDAERVLIGVTMRDKEGRPDGALVVSMRASIIEKEIPSLQDFYRLLSSLVRDDGYLFIIDKETGVIQCSTDTDVEGLDVETFGISTEMLDSEFNGTIDYQSVKNYIVSGAPLDDYYIIYGSNYTSGLPVIFRMIAATCIVVLFSLFITIVMPLSKGIKLMEAAEAAAAAGNINTTSIGIDVRVFKEIHESATRQGSFSKNMSGAFKIYNPEDYLKGLIGFYSFFLMVTSSTMVFSRSEILEVLSSWNSAFNIVNVALSVMSIATIVIYAIIVRFILRLISRFVSQRGATLCRLLRSLTSYAAILYSIGIFLIYNGVDVRNMMASVSIMGVVIGLGSQSLMSDLLAGVFIVFEGVVKVGDIVKVNDVYGVVKEIGLRTIQIVTKSGDIVVINNSTIKAMGNLSKFLSAAAVSITISHDEDIQRVEDILTEEFKKAEEENLIKGAVWGPRYNGLHSINKEGMEITILAGCDEINVSSVRTRVTGYTKKVLDKYGIKCQSTSPVSIINYDGEPEGRGEAIENLGDVINRKEEME